MTTTFLKQTIIWQA